MVPHEVNLVKQRIKRLQAELEAAKRRCNNPADTPEGQSYVTARQEIETAWEANCRCLNKHRRELLAIPSVVAGWRSLQGRRQQLDRLRKRQVPAAFIAKELELIASALEHPQVAELDTAETIAAQHAAELQTARKAHQEAYRTAKARFAAEKASLAEQLHAAHKDLRTLVPSMPNQLAIHSRNHAPQKQVVRSKRRKKRALVQEPLSPSAPCEVVTDDQPAWRFCLVSAGDEQTFVLAKHNQDEVQALLRSQLVNDHLDTNTARIITTLHSITKLSADQRHKLRAVKGSNSPFHLWKIQPVNKDYRLLLWIDEDSHRIDFVIKHRKEAYRLP